LTRTTNKVFIYIGSVLIFFAAVCYAYFQELYFLAIPFAVIIAAYLIQYPQYLFYLLMLSIPWSVEFNFNPGLGTDLPDEPLMLLGSLATVFYLIYRRKSIRIANINFLVAIIILQILWASITVITSSDFIISIKYILAKGWYLLSFFVLPLLLFKNPNFFRTSVLLFLCSMLAVTALVLVRQEINGWTFEKINESVRPFFRNHVNYSSVLIFMVPLLIAILQLVGSKKIEFFLYFLLIGVLIAVYFSYARGAWLALIAGLIAYWLLKKRLMVFGFLSVLVLILIGVFWIKLNERYVKFSNDYSSTIFHSNFREHLIATYQLKDLSNAERIYRWVAGVRMIKDNWQTGSGPSTFYSQYKSYALPAFKTYVSKNPEKSTVHNYFLLMLIEQGVIGCLLFLALLTAAFWYTQKIYFRTDEKFWKVVVSAVASILAMQCVINFLSDMIETDKVGSVFYLCIATLVIADIKTRKDKSNLSADVESVS